MSLPRLDPTRRAQLADALARFPGPGGLTAALAGEADLPRLAALGDALFGHEALSRADWRYRLTRGHGFILTLSKDKRLLSYTVVELNARQRRVYVVETGTEPGARGQGLGRLARRLMHGAVAWLGYRTVATHVRVSNTAAQRLNLSLGMALQARVPGYYDDGEDAFAYRARLDGLELPPLFTGPAADPAASPRR